MQITSKAPYNSRSKVNFSSIQADTCVYLQLTDITCGCVCQSKYLDTKPCSFWGNISKIYSSFVRDYTLIDRHFLYLVKIAKASSNQIKEWANFEKDHSHHRPEELVLNYHRRTSNDITERTGPLTCLRQMMALWKYETSFASSHVPLASYTAKNVTGCCNILFAEQRCNNIVIRLQQALFKHKVATVLFQLCSCNLSPK